MCVQNLKFVALPVPEIIGVEKRERGRIQGLSIFKVPLIISAMAMCKATNFKFCTRFHGIDPNKSP